MLMTWRAQARRRRCVTFTYFYWGFSGLLQVGLFLVAVHLIFPFVLGIWERAGYLKQEGDEGTERLHPSRRRKNATEEDSNLPRMLAS